MRLIDADAFGALLVDTAVEYSGLSKLYTRETLQMVMDLLVYQPTVDAAPVIRCKDCKYAVRHGPDKCRCELLDYLGAYHCWVELDGYCYRAKADREDDNTNAQSY